MSKTLDYSKWDKIADNLDTSDDDVDEDDDLQMNNNNTSNEPETTNNFPSPQVTRLDKPSSVTIGPNGVSINPSSFTHKQKPNENLINELNKDLEFPIESKQNNTENGLAIIEKWFENGGIHNKEYLWSQTRDNVNIKFLIPKNIKHKNIKIEYNNEINELKIFINNKLIYKKIFVNNILIDKDDIGIHFCGLDWELKDILINIDNNFVNELTKYLINELNIKNSNNNINDIINLLKESRFLIFDLNKKHISDNVKQWWDIVFKNETKIDIVKRVKNRKTKDIQTMNDVWQTAHQKFKEKIKNIKPQIINTNNNNDSDCDDID